MPNPYADVLGLKPKGPDRDKPKKKALHPSQKRAPKQEKESAIKYRGRVTAASGSKLEKGDVRTKGIARIECKTTANKSFSVTREMVEKLENAALSCAEIPACIIEFNDGNGKKISELCVIPTWALESLIGDVHGGRQGDKE